MHFVRGLVVVAVAVAAIPAFAQTEGLTVSVDDVRTSVGETFEIGIQVDSDDPISVLLLQASNDPDAIRVTGWRLGTSLGRQIEENGEPSDCDVVVYPDGAAIQSVMLFNTPLSTDEYGTDYLIVEYEVTASDAQEAQISLSAREFLESSEDNKGEIIGGTAVVHIGASPILRGDANGDTQRNLSDAIGILSYLFQAGSLECVDAADVDDNGAVQITDAVVLLQTLFGGGGNQSLRPCEQDATVDELPACEQTSCAQ